jgi:endonuclease/exonuclease/phosphatase family metal-dependent hydrolase
MGDCRRGADAAPRTDTLQDKSSFRRVSVLKKRLVLTAPLLLVALAGTATAEWNPSTGKWGKSDETDVRIMTFNIQDGICSTADKSEGYNSWHALARLVAALRPDVLMLQEAGDNEGNGTGTDVDSVANLTTTLQLFFHGGSDPFKGGQVGAYVQKYAPGYDLPQIWVSSATDSFNRNVVLSRYPFTDLNGDGITQRPVPAGISPDLYAWGGNGGIRGFMFGELDMPDDVYAGDLVIGNAHMRSGSAEQDKQERERAARNVAYYIDFLFNGGGGDVPDPRGKIDDQPPATRVLDALTAVIIGGDWNEDEQTNGRKGPAEWLTRADLQNGDDGTDRDRSDATFDASLEPRSGSRATYGSSTKLDYLAWQDSIATPRRTFIFDSLKLIDGWYPPELYGYPTGPGTVSSAASDHRPVLGDFVLPVSTRLPGDLNCDGVVDFGDIGPFVLALSDPDAYAALYPDCPLENRDINGDGLFNFGDINPFVGLLSGQ